MRFTNELWTSFCAGLTLLACGEVDGGRSSATSGALAVEQKESERGRDGDAQRDLPIEGEFSDDVPGDDHESGLDCTKGGAVGDVAVVFACDEVTVLTCKDLSNVVLELDDGSHHKVEGLHGHDNTFTAPPGHFVVGVWVKAGANASGDGPGYGERFDASAEGCSAEPDETPAEDPPAVASSDDGDVPAPVL